MTQIDVTNHSIPAPKPLRVLSKDEIVAAPDLAREIVPVPEWGEDAAVLVQAMDVNRRLAYFEFGSEVQVNPKTGTREFLSKPYMPYNAAAAALCVIDEAGSPIFSLAEIELLGSKNPAVIERIGTVARRLSKIGEFSEVADKDKAPLPANADSPSDSPAISG